jgi:hypothetical protein
MDWFEADESVPTPQQAHAKPQQPDVKSPESNVTVQPGSPASLASSTKQSSKPELPAGALVKLQSKAKDGQTLTQFNGRVVEVMAREGKIYKILLHTGAIAKVKPKRLTLIARRGEARHERALQAVIASLTEQGRRVRADWLAKENASAAGKPPPSAARQSETKPEQQVEAKQLQSKPMQKKRKRSKSMQAQNPIGLLRTSPRTTKRGGDAVRAFSTLSLAAHTHSEPDNSIGDREASDNTLDEPCNFPRIPRPYRRRPSFSQVQRKRQAAAKSRFGSCS